MDDLPVVTCREEGGLYTPDRDPAAPIRIYADGRVEDDIFGDQREIYDRLKVQEIVARANKNRERGYI